MKKELKPHYSAAIAKGIKTEKMGLPSDKQIKNSVYAKCGKK